MRLDAYDPPSVCGDGVVQAGEACDDGEPVPWDGVQGWRPPFPGGPLSQAWIDGSYTGDAGLPAGATGSSVVTLELQQQL